MHRFIKEISINGKNANAQITLFEKIEGNNKIYTLELESLNKSTSLSTQAKSAEVAVEAQSATATPTEVAPIAKTDKDIIPQKTLNGDSIANPYISYAIQHENISKDLAEKIANNCKIHQVNKIDLINKANVSYFDENNMTLYKANIGNYIDDEFGMTGDKFFLNNVREMQSYIPEVKSVEEFKHYSIKQIELSKKAAKAIIDNTKDKEKAYKEIRYLTIEPQENASRVISKFSKLEEYNLAKEFYCTKFQELLDQDIQK